MTHGVVFTLLSGVWVCPFTLFYLFPSGPGAGHNQPQNPWSVSSSFSPTLGLTPANSFPWSWFAPGTSSLYFSLRVPHLREAFFTPGLTDVLRGVSSVFPALDPAFPVPHSKIGALQGQSFFPLFIAFLTSLHFLVNLARYNGLYIFFLSHPGSLKIPQHLVMISCESSGICHILATGSGSLL